jgi:hypothetical protein
MAKQLFEDVFNKGVIHEILFVNTKAVLIFPTVKELEVGNKPLFDRWNYILKTKYENNIPVEQMVDMDAYSQKKYQDNAPYLPEYTRIIAITIGNVYAEDGKLKRHIQKFVNEDEYHVLAQFMDILYHLSSEGTKSSPNYFPILCGHNIISYDIPMLIKRFLIHRDKFENNKELPLMLKRALNIKPWESGIIDTVNVWKFNGFDTTSLMLISDFLELKKTVDLMSMPELSKYYWNNVKEKPSETLEFISLQSATQTNLVVQFMNILRQL